MIGAVARCGHGKIGVIFRIDLDGKTNDTTHVVYKGVTLDGKAWQSKNPEIIAPNINQYILNFLIALSNSNVEENIRTEIMKYENLLHKSA